MKPIFAYLSVYYTTLGLYKSRRDQCLQLAHVLRLRAKWLGASHTDSARVLYSLNWKPLDIMLAYLTGVTSEYTPAIDPDCAVDAAHRDPEAAVWLLDPDHYRAYFEGQYHPSYDQDMAKAWTELLYFHGDWQDRSPLEKGHRLKRMNAFYCQILERLRDPGWPWRSMEEDLRKTGVLPSDTPPDWTHPKLAKRQRLALTRTLVCQYLWRTPDLLAALFASKDPTLFTALVWGLYQEGHLTTAFLLDASGTAWGEDGQPMNLPADGQIGLVTPVELDKKRLSLWKKRLKEVGSKPPIRQLTLPAILPDFGAFEGVVTKHITIYSSAGKWGLDMGVLPRHSRADLLDPLHGYGARIRFDDVWDGPEYSGNNVTVLGVEFYRMDPVPFQNCLPRRAIISPKALPLRFTTIAAAAFRQLAGT